MDRRLGGEASELKLGERLDLEALRDRAQDRSDQWHPGEVEADWGSVHRKKGAVGRVTAPGSRTQSSPWPGPSSSPRSGCACWGPPHCYFRLFMPQRGAVHLRRLHFWSRWRLWCPCWTALTSKVLLGLHLLCSTWGGRMGRTSWDQDWLAPAFTPSPEGYWPPALGL